MAADADVPRASRPWFRFYVEALADRKLRRLTPAQRWVWVGVLAAARQSPYPGVLLVSEGLIMGEEDLADICAVSAREVTVALRSFEEAGMIERDFAGAWVVTNWKERQFESDDTTARTSKHRSKERRGNVPTSFLGTPPETETDTETENDVAPAPPTPRRVDPLFDALAEVCDINPAELTQSARGALNRALHDLRRVGATPEEIRIRSGRYTDRYQIATLTPTALAKHWPQLTEDRRASVTRLNAVDRAKRGQP